MPQLKTLEQATQLTSNGLHCPKCGCEMLDVNKSIANVIKSIHIDIVCSGKECNYKTKRIL